LSEDPEIAKIMQKKLRLWLIKKEQPKNWARNYWFKRFKFWTNNFSRKPNVSRFLGRMVWPL